MNTYTAHSVGVPTSVYRWNPLTIKPLSGASSLFTLLVYSSAGSAEREPFALVMNVITNSNIMSNMVEWKKLGDIMSIVRGASPRPIKNYITNDPDGINWIKIGDVSPNAKYITTTAEKITREGAAKSRHLNVGDFILSNSMSFGRPYILKTDGCIHDGWIAMSDFEKIISSGYLYEVLNSELVQKYWKKKANDGGAMSNLNSDIVRGTIIPIPSLEEQNRIVGILETFTDSIENLKKQIEQRRKQYEFYRDQLLDLEGKEGVEMKTLGELSLIVTKQTGFDYSSKIKPALQIKSIDNAIPFLQTKNFTGRKFDYNTDYYVPTHIVNQFPKIVLDKKCLLLSIVGASIGNVGLFPGTTKCFLGGAICVLKFHEDINVHYIYEIMSSWYGQKLIRSKTKGAGQATITVEDIRNFTIPLPSAKEQTRIVSILDTFEASISNLEAQLEQRQKQYEYYRNQLLTFE